MIDKIFKAWGDFVVARAKWIIIITLIVVAGVGIFMKNLYIDSDIKNWVSPKNEIATLPNYIDNRFGGTTPMLVLVEADDIFSYDTLTLVRKVSRKIEKIEGVDSVMSVSETVDMTAEEGTIVIEDLIPGEIPQDAQKLKELKEYVLSKDLYRDRMVSANAKTCLIIVKIKPDVKADQVGKKIKQEITQLTKGSKEKLYFGGVPSLMNDLSESVVSDIVFLVPIVVLVVLVILFLSFRTLRGLTLPLVAVALATVMALGLMAIFGGTFSLLGAALPVILVAVGSAYGIHMVNRYYEESAGNHSTSQEIVKRAVKEVGLPVVMAGLTTFFGFLSLTVSDLVIIRDFGIFISIGVIIAFVIALMFIPALLTLLPVQVAKDYQTGHNQETQPGIIATLSAKLIFRLRFFIIALFLVVCGVCIYFTKDVKPEMNYLSYFGPKSQAVKVAEIINTNYRGFSPFSVYFKGDIEDPEVLRLMTIVEEDVISRNDMAAVGGVNGLISELNYLVDNIRVIPEDKDEVQDLWSFVEGQDMLKSLVTTDRKEAIVSFMLPSVSSEYEANFYKPLLKFLNAYQKGIKVIEVSPTNEDLVNLCALRLRNVYHYNGGIDRDSADWRLVSHQAAEQMLKVKPEVPREKIRQYLLSPECEIEIKSGAVAENIVDRLAGLSDFSTNSLVRVLNLSLPRGLNYDSSDVKYLAESILIHIQDYTKKKQMDTAFQVVNKAYPLPGGEGRVRTCLATLLWQTMPVPLSHPGTAVRELKLKSLELTGNSYLYYLIKNRLNSSQLISLFLALVMVFILNSITFRSPWRGLVSLGPIAYTLLVNFGIMGLFHIDLDVVTVTIASIAIGTGIDYTIHFVSRYTREYHDREGNEERALAQTLATTGRAILFNALSVGLGFLVLILSKVTPLRTLGAMLGVSMVVSSYSALVLLPLLMTGILRRERQKKLKTEVSK